MMGAVAAFAASSTQAAFIYEHDFDGDGTDLAGTTADKATGTDGSTSSAAWTANGTFNKNGTVETSYGIYSAALPFSPSNSRVYTLTADVNTTAGSGDWLAIGFEKTNTTNQGFNSGTNGAAWIMLRNSRGSGASSSQYFAGPGTGGGANYDTTTMTGVVALKVVLDTTSATNWKATWYADGTMLGTYTYTTNPTIAYVGFTKNGAGGGTIDNFKLDAVPEPAAFGLLALAAPLFGRRRRAH